jgi:hypothetical protein
VTRSPYPSRREIIRRTRQIYILRGRPPGSPMQFWREAEQHLLDIAARRVMNSSPWPGRGRPGLRRPG